MLFSRASRNRPSGIRKILELASGLPDPFDLSIGPPDLEVPAAVKRAAIRAIEEGVALEFAPQHVVATPSRGSAG